MNDNHLLDALTRQGVLISVSCRYWRAAEKLQAADLGLDPADVADRLISLGHKRLLPKDALAAFALIESRAHSLVENSTFPFLNNIARFLPNAKLAEVTRWLNELEAELIAAGDQQSMSEARAQEPLANTSTCPQLLLRHGVHKNIVTQFKATDVIVSECIGALAHFPPACQTKPAVNNGSMAIYRDAFKCRRNGRGA